MTVPLWTNSRREAWAGWLFIAPEFLGILILGVFPLFFSLFLSFCDWNLVGGVKAIRFVGLDNYKQLLHDLQFYAALKNNLLYSVVTVPIGMGVALLAAVVIQSSVYVREYFKVAVFIPYISTTVAVATVFSALFHPSLGAINRMLMSLGDHHPPKWLGSTDYALWAIIIIAVWQGIGYNVVIYLAGLTGIPDELYEAAKIDGAGIVQQFVKVTVPLLAPTTFFLSLTGIIASFKVFDLIAFLTEGGPNNATNVLVYYMYKEGFQNFRMGYASTLSWALFLVIALVTAVFGKLQKNQV